MSTYTVKSTEADERIIAAGVDCLDAVAAHDRACGNAIILRDSDGKPAVFCTTCGDEVHPGTGRHVGESDESDIAFDICEQCTGLGYEQ